MPNFELSRNSVECDRCGEVFTDESSYISHGEADHGDKEEDFEEVADTYDLKMNPNLTEANLREAKKLLRETNQQELYHSKPFKNPKAKIPTKLEPHNSADDLVAGLNGYNDDPNSFFYNNKNFKKGSSTLRTSQLGESVSTYDHFTQLEDEKEDWVVCDECGQEWDEVNFGIDDAKEHLKNVHGIDSTFESGEANNDAILYNNIDTKKCEHCGNINSTDWGSCPSCTTGREADNYPKKSEMTDNEWEKDLGDLKTRYETENEDVDYDNLGTVTTQGEEQPVEDIPALESINFGYENYEKYPTIKVKPHKTKASEVYDGIIDQYEKFQATEDEDVTEMITAQKLGGSGSESIAKSLTLRYGVSREDALEKVYSIEVSNNDRVANTFFQKKFSECSEAEVAELRLYCGSDE